MTTYLNIQPENVRRVSKFPFDVQSSLQFGNHIFPYAEILSLELTLVRGALPISMEVFELQGDTVKIHLQDARKTQVGECLILPETQVHPIKDGVLTVGQIQATPVLYSFLKGVLQPFGGVYTAGQNALILASACITCCRCSVCTALKVQNLNQTFTGDVTLRFQNNIISNFVQGATGQCFTFSICPDPLKTLQQLQTPIQTVNDVDLTNKHLIIRPALYSNLRVDSAGQNQIKLLGVLDD